MMKLKKSLKTNKHRFAILLLLVLGWTSCDSFSNYPEKERFDPREHPLIEKGDTLLFIGTENVDSFYVQESQFYLPHARYGDEDYEQYVGVMTHGTYADTSIRFEISINIGGYYLYYYIPFRDDIDPYVSLSSIYLRNDIYTMQIRDINIVNLHKAGFKRNLYEANSGKYSHLFVEVDTAYYSKTYGFVKYIKYTGEEFVLSEESLKMLMARE